MSPLVAMHLGDLHAYETALVALLAFGPFVVLAVVVVVLRRRDADHRDDAASTPGVVRGAGSREGRA